jgi:hypothetical protein
VRHVVLYEAYALLCMAALMAVSAFSPLAIPGLVIWLIPSGLALLGAVVQAVRVDARPERVLWDADLAYGYRHLLPTAFELWRVRKQSEKEGKDHEGSDVADIVIDQGLAQVQYLRPETVYPLALPRRLYLLPLGALACLVILLAAQGISRDAPPNPWAGYIEELRSQSGRIARRSEALGDEEGARLAQQLEELSDTLESRPEQKEIERELNELLPRLENHMRSLGASDLVAGEEAGRNELEGEAETTGSLRARRVEDGSSAPVDIGGTSDGEPAPARDGAAAGDSTQEPEEDGTESGGEGDEGDEGDAEDLGRELRSAQNNLQELGEQLAQGDESRSDRSDDAAPQPDEQPGSGRSGEREQGGSSVQGTSDEAGIGSTPDLGEEPTARLSEIIREMTELPSNEEHSAFTELFSRETPGEPRTSLEERAVTPEFQRQIEAAVGRSTVPANMQGYVRDYFLRIARAAEME